MNPEKFFDTVRSANGIGEVREFVDERVQDAEASSRPIQFVDGDGNRVTYNFIHPGSKVTANTRMLFHKGFHVNDSRVYDQFAADAHKHAQVDVAPDDLLLGVVQTAVMEYFGDQRGDMTARKKLHGGFLRGKASDIATIKDQGVAQCTEFAAVAHNLCQVAGMPSIFMGGAVRVDEELFGHSWQIVRHNGTERIFDVANPNVDEEGLYPFSGEVNALEILMGVPTTLYRQGLRQKQRFEYKIKPTFPATQEGFHEYRSRGLGVYASPQELQRMALEDAAMSLVASDFYTKAPGTTRG
jgi:hypothetical protein